MSTLKELIEEANQIEQLLADSEGLITPEIEKSLAIVNENIPVKVDSYAYLLSRFSSQEEFYKAEAEKYQRMANGFKKSQAYVKERLKSYLEKMPEKRLDGLTRSFCLRKSNPELIIDPTELDSNYMMIIPERIEPDKSRIKEDLKSDKEIKGAKLEPSWALITSFKK